MQSMAAPGVSGLEKLTRRHAVKLCPDVGVSVEACGLAVGAVVGYASVKSASRMNSAVVIFLDSTDKVNQLVESGVNIQGTLVPVLPLVTPARKIIISNVPPFLSNEALLKELSRHGKIVSMIKMIPLGCKSALLKHVMSFRRQVFMILKDNEELNLVLKFRVDDYDYTVHVTSDTLKCFGCGAEGHLVRSCPGRTGDRQAAASAAEPPVTAAGQRATHGSTPENGSQHMVTQYTEKHAQKHAEKHAGGNRAQGEHTEQQADDDAGQTVTRVAEALDQEENDVSMDDCVKMSVKRKSTETKVATTLNKKMSKNDSQKHCEVSVDNTLGETLDNTMGETQDNTLGETQDNTLGETQDNTQEDTQDETLGETQCSQNDEEEHETRSSYSFSRIRNFLMTTKGMRAVKVEEFFPDLQLFHQSVKFLMKNTGEPAFTEQELFRLKKLLSKVRAQLLKDE